MLHVIIKDGDVEVRILLGEEVIRKLAGHDANYFFNNDEAPMLKIGTEYKKWTLKMVYGTYKVN